MKSCDIVGGYRKPKNRRLRALMSVTAITWGAVNVVASTSEAASPDSSSNTILTIADFSGLRTDNFNPFTGSSTGQNGLIYEPLMQLDLHSATEEPWLATSYSWSKGGKQLTFKLRSGVEWSDGTPFTGQDVAFTFNLMRRFPGINLDSLPLAGSTAPSATTVVINFTQPAYQLFDDIVETPPVPEHIWSHVNNPVTYPDMDPIGTGPYVFRTFSPEAITLMKNPHYWQASKLRVPEVQLLGFDSHASDLAALESNEVSWTNIVASTKEQVEIRSADPNIRFWLAPTVMTPMLLNYRDYPFNILQVREAISDAINRDYLAKVAVDGVYFPATSPTGIDPLVTPDALAPQYKTLVYKPSAKTAKSLLESVGFKMGSDGIFRTPKGTPFSFDLLVNSGFVNYISLSEAMIKQLAAAGIQVHLVTETSAALGADVDMGHFQATFAPELTDDSAPAAYLAYLDTGAYRPVGTTTAFDLERLQDPALQKLINKLDDTAPESTAHTQALYALEAFTVKDVPFIPIFINTDEGNYNYGQFTGWPSAKDPYADPAALRYNAELVLLNVRPKS